MDDDALAMELDELADELREHYCARSYNEMLEPERTWVATIHKAANRLRAPV